MRPKFHAPWLPMVAGVVAALLAVHGARELLMAAPDRADFFLFGVLVQGDLAWTAASVHVVFLGWLAYACFQKQARAVVGIIAYCGYWIVTVWVWSQLYAPGSVGTKIITASFVTVVLLAVCRIAVGNRAAFDG